MAGFKHKTKGTSLDQDEFEAVDSHEVASEAQGDILIRDATGWGRLPAGTLNEFLQTKGAAANPAWGGGYTKVLKTTETQVVNNSVTLVNDDTLLLPVTNGDVWEILAIIKYSSNATADFKAGVILPGGTFIGLGWGKDAADAVSILNLGNGVPFPASGDRNSMIIHGVATITITGNVAVQWAQVTATVVDTKVNINSCIIAHKLN